jgi:predicted HTH transcriptional regulator
MRRINICEERGSGIDKVVALTELHQLPAPVFRVVNGYTISILFAHKELKEMNKQDRIWATYLHASLRYIQNNFMTNTSLRDRFGIDVKNRSMASKIINEALQAGKIKIYDESVGTKAREYVPWWAK